MTHARVCILPVRVAAGFSGCPRAAVGGRVDPSGPSAEGGPGPTPSSGRRHGLQSVLLLALQAVLAGASSWIAIAQWARTAPQALGICGASPSAATFRRV